MDAGIQTADKVPSHIQVLLAKRIVILGNKSQTVAAPAQFQQPVQQQLAKLMPTKVFQRGGVAGRALLKQSLFKLHVKLPLVNASRKEARQGHVVFQNSLAIKIQNEDATLVPGPLSHHDKGLIGNKSKEHCTLKKQALKKKK